MRYQRKSLTILLVKNDRPCLKNDKSIVTEGADKGSAVVVWDTEDYIKVVGKQLGDNDVYEEVTDDPEPLINTIHRTKEKLAKEMI